VYLGRQSICGSRVVVRRFLGHWLINVATGCTGISSRSSVSWIAASQRCQPREPHCVSEVYLSSLLSPEDQVPFNTPLNHIPQPDRCQSSSGRSSSCLDACIREQQPHCHCQIVKETRKMFSSSLEVSDYYPVAHNHCHNPI
jgi:hypothetical protein